MVVSSVPVHILGKDLKSCTMGKFYVFGEEPQNRRSAMNRAALQPVAKKGHIIANRIMFS